MINQAFVYIKNNFSQLLRYAVVTGIGIVLLVGVNYFSVSVLKLDPRLGYFFGITMCYVFIYFSSAVYTFKSELNTRSAKSFLIYIFVFWTVNNLFFNVIYSITHWNYLLILTINMALLFPIRFYSQKYLVFKDRPFDQK